MSPSGINTSKSSLSISVITVCYQSKDGLSSTIESILQQDYPDFEYIIIDGGSTDGTLDVIGKIESRLAFWSSEPDKGIYDAMNKGIRQAHSEWLLFLNAGDTLVDHQVFSSMLPYLAQEDFSIVYGNIIKVYDNRKVKSCQLPQKNIDFMDLFCRTIDHQAAFIRRELFSKYGFYDINYKLASDWLFFMNAVGLHHEPCLYVDRDISFFQMDGMSSKHPELYQQERTDALKKMCGVYYDYLKELSEYRMSSLLRCLLIIRLKLRKTGFRSKIKSILGLNGIDM